MLRNYRAFTMAEALAAVKRDLGPDAVVLHTRTSTQGGILGFGRRQVVEVTAAPASAVPERGQERRAAKPTDVVAARARTAYGVAAPAAARDDEPMRLDRERTRLLAQAMAVTLERERSEQPRTAAATVAEAHATATARATEAPPTGPAKRFVLVPAHERAQPPDARAPRPIRTSAPSVATPKPRPTVESVAAPAEPDLVSIGRMVDEVIRRGGGGARDPERLTELYAALVAQEVGDELARSIVDDLKASLSPAELASAHAVRSAAIERVAALLPVGEPLLPGPDGWRRGGRPLTVAFVGPTGVGKTTTVAKIAATLTLRHGARVGLVTCDTYRIAAVDQLRTYAEIIGVPLEVALSPGRMRQALAALSALDVILIDTAGRGQRDAERLGELRAMLAAAEPHRTQLVLSSVASARALEREADAFGALGVDAVVLTKLDEAVGLGAALRVLRRIGRSLSYVTTGQEVPRDIGPAQPRALAAMVVGEEPDGPGAAVGAGQRAGEEIS